ncbi:MAG TPA: hypothetical protein VMX17_12615 [Candidatus Glassbacteria bacterium]|nr:hypothetical protein [Candidatus Glassbacteria bacterium]
MIEITKKITFKFDANSDKITLPDLLSKGYVRTHIVALFEELQSVGFGEFKQGTRGRGQSHKFIKNSKCPTDYSIVIDEKPRGRPRKNAAIKAEVISYNPMANEDNEEIASIYNSDDKINIENNNISSIKNDINLIVQSDMNLTGIVSDISLATNDFVLLDDPIIGEDEIGEELSEDLIVENI